MGDICYRVGGTVDSPQVGLIRPLQHPYSSISLSSPLLLRTNPVCYYGLEVERADEERIGTTALLAR